MTNKRLQKKYGVDTAQYHAARQARNKVKNGTYPAFTMESTKIIASKKIRGGPKEVYDAEGRPKTVSRIPIRKTFFTFTNTVRIFAEGVEENA